MPDIGHARLHLDNVLCELLPGDGWDSYVKPFRSIEDLHVLAAITAWLYGIGRDGGWPAALRKASVSRCICSGASRTWAMTGAACGSPASVSSVRNTAS